MQEDQTVQKESEQGRPSFIVGIGASAGGLEALEQFFDNVPTDTGLAFVVVQHLSPDFDSLMDELLERHTKLPVRTVEDGMRVEPDSIYLIPPRKQMVISGGTLLLTDKDPSQGLSLPINVFFRSLAQDVGGRAIGIVLSGTGSDGSQGIREISAAGGLVFAQSGESARFDGMPKSALETGCVDVSLSPAEIGPALVRYVENPTPRNLTTEQARPPIDETDMAKLMRLLRNTYGIDFSHYKQTTVQRRIERRLLLNHTSDFSSYVDQLSDAPAELNSLYRDLLIGVTQFFRDQEAFQELDQRVLPELLQKTKSEDEMRLWVAGCATGEEAYSLAILVHEHLTRVARPINVKIFATDVHQASLDIAGAGCYDEEKLADISPERLKRYFTRKGSQYQVNSDLREMIVFAQHNVLKDAPFTKLDLVSCRNLLIYFEPDAQRRAISLFHFALKQDRILLLGPSEGLAGLDSEFEMIDRKWKFFRKVSDSRLFAEIRLPLPSVDALNGTRLPSPPTLQTKGPTSNLSPVFDRLLESCVPSGVLIDEEHKLVHVFGDGGKYLNHQPGEAPSDVISLFDSELRTALAGAIQRAAKQKAAVSYSSIPVNKNGSASRLSLAVKPLIDDCQNATHFLVTIDEVPHENAEETHEEIDINDVSRERISNLESELSTSKENLQATIEELEASNEELHATNEELVASNEELQSTNEELHSVNEELYTVNAEYQRKITELSELTDDMDNLLASTNVGVVFLDRELCIRKFTPEAARVFNILDQDVGRSFEAFASNIKHSELDKDIDWVLKSGQPAEREVQDRFGGWLLLRVLPYSSSSDVEGVVVTLIDIATLKKAESELLDRERQLNGILQHAPAFIYMKGLQGQYLLANRRAKKVVGTSSKKLIGKNDYDVLPRNVADRIESHDRHVAATGEILQVEETIPRNGKGITYLSVKYPLRDESGQIFAVAGISTDITRRKIAQRRAKQAVKQRDRFLAMLSHELRNPLAAVKNGVEILSRFEPEEPIAQQAVNAVKTQADQMARLMDDLLDISRVTQGKIELSKEVLDLRDVASRSAEAVRSMMAEHQHEFVNKFPDEPVYIHGDAARLQQIQVNLLINAAKYTREPGTVTFSLSSEDSTAILKVRDTGVGMSESLQKRVFDPFFQAEGTMEQSEGGMGVGLTLVRSLVDLHGGDIQIESSGRGHGTEITVRLPLVEAFLDNPSVQEETHAAETDLRILLVEDNDQLRFTTQALLKLEGYEVDAASDGLSALTACEVNPPDVALVDIGLPAIDGYEVARRIRANHNLQDICLIALTGYGQEKDRSRALEIGFDEHVTKPVDVAHLRTILQTVGTLKQSRNYSQCNTIEE